MDLVLSNLEKYALGILAAGLVLALVAFFWLLIAALRGARTRGPLLLFLLAGLAVALPRLTQLLDDRPWDLSAWSDVLNGGLRVQLATVDGRVGPVVAIKARALLYLFGAALGTLGLLWLVIASFGQWEKVRRPVYLFLFAAFLIGLPFAANRLAQAFVDFGPRERVVDGKLHVTLTGWDRQDYSMLRARPQTVVLQMANPDVTDATLQYLEDMTALEELDLSKTGVTDAGLASLRPLTALRILRLADTAVTDAGLKEHLLPIESLERLDLSRTQVSPEAVRDWREAKPGRRALR